MRIFDFHLHPGYDFHSPALDPRSFADRLKEAGITRCAGSFIEQAMNGRPLAEYEQILPALNRRAWEFHQQLPEFYLPGIHIHPDLPELSLKELEQHARRGGVLVGELVHYMMGWRYSHPNLLPLLAAARDLGLVVCIHPTGSFEQIETLMENLPELQLVVAHLGGYDLFDRMLALIQNHPTVYADLSAYGAERPGMLREAVDRVGSGRILFGTDYPGCDPAPFLDYIQREALSADETENILYNNAAKLLKVE